MPDWDRLAKLTINRRVELGYPRRTNLATDAGLSLRTLGDIETARKTSYDPATLAALEHALKWQAGSVEAVLGGGQPTPQTDPATDEAHRLFIGDDAALVKVMRSGLPDDKKRELMRILIAEREAFDRQRIEHAEQLIRLVAGEH